MAGANDDGGDEMIFPASQASSHFPLEPVSAAVLCSRETKRRDAAVARGRVQVGSQEVDEEVLCGGFERGSVVGLSSESEQMGILISMQALAKTLCGKELENDERGKEARVMVVTTQPPAAILPPLRDAIRTELVVRGAAEADVATRLRRCLGRVSVSRVFDFEGLWEALGDLDILPESPEPRVVSSPGVRAPSRERSKDDDKHDTGDDKRNEGVAEGSAGAEAPAEDAANSSRGQEHAAPEPEVSQQPERIVLPELKPRPQPIKSTRTEIADSDEDDDEDAISLPSSSSSSLSPPPSTIRSPTPFMAADSPKRGADEEEVTEGAEGDDLNDNVEGTPEQVTEELHEEETESRPPPPEKEIPEATPAVAAPESRSPEDDVSKGPTLPDIILITHFHSLMTALFTRRDRQSAHDSLQRLSSHLRYLSRNLETSPLIMLLNSTSSSKESTMSKPVNAQGGQPPPPPNGGEHGTGSGGKAVDPTLRSIFNPPALNITGYGYGGNQAASRRNKPTFGLVFSQLLDLHLLCTKIPRDKEDAERLYTAAPGGGGGGEDDGTGGVRFVWALEVLLDEIGVWEHGTEAEVGGRRRASRKSREQRWGVVDVKSGRVVDAFEAVERKKAGEIRVVGGFGGPRRGNKMAVGHTSWMHRGGRYIMPLDPVFSDSGDDTLLSYTTAKTRLVYILNQSKPTMDLNITCTGKKWNSMQSRDGAVAMIGSEYFSMGRRIQIRFNPSTSLRRNLSEKLTRHVRSSSVDSSPSSPSAAALISDTQDIEDMKASCVLPYAAVAASVSAFALPETRPEPSIVRIQDGSSRESSWETTRARSYDKSSSLGDVVNAIGGMFYQAAGAVAQAGRRVMGHPTDAHDIETGHAAPVVLQQITSEDPRSRQEEADKGENLLTLIKESGMQTEYFTTLLTSYDKVHDMLLSNNDEQTLEQEQFTIFVPTDSAFRKLEGVFELSRAELLGEILEYHVLPGRYTYQDLRGLRTAETVLEKGGGGELRRQRLRTTEGPSGVEINFYARVLASESRESGDGAVVVHFIDEVLIPPPRWDILVGAAVPEDTLGVFAKAMKRSGASEEVLRRLRGGSGITVFAPSNEAWDTLGEEAMGFLFSSREGAKFLEALVRYHFVAEVIYTDFFKGVEMDEEEMEKKTDGGRGLGEDADGAGRVRRDVQTLLDGARVTIEAVVSRSAGRTGDAGRPVGVVKGGVGVNGAAVSARDVPVRDGVVHIVDEVLLPPPAPPLLSSTSSSRRIGVEELKRRLARFVELGEEGDWSEEL
ncbi:uncharacterized protein CCOS01_14474 [Colletotrichum costaricense]|uniref:FAS1 domain-containing protein n=1 Tax=Colletotrichum costaricense TaxID=1209916 RepID=A0AAI9YK64_9PEZI|nr:uncharacterized protein CCOS01_14474 [Colletotrichum costaricense]KAK1513532.1 hypothetical protein CCOS01_14474 [Colletotrichum costaricense]